MVDTIRPDGAGPIDQDGESVASVAFSIDTRAQNPTGQAVTILSST